MAKVTLITQWFFPEPEYLWKDLAHELQKQNHSVTVVTAFPNYPTGEIYDDYKQSINYIEYIDGIKVIRLPVYPSRSKSKIKRAISYLSFFLSLSIIGIFRIPKSDIFLSYSPPLTVSFAVAWLSFIRRTPFILNIQDLWPDTLISSGMIKKGVITNIILWAAKLLYRRSSSLVVLSEGFRKHLNKLGVDKSKIHVISNWSHETDPVCYQKTKVDHWIKKLGIKSNDFIVTFAGNMGPAQALETIIESARLLKNQEKIKILLVGDGISLSDLKATTEKIELKNIIFTGRVNHDDMASIYEMSDALLIHLKKDSLFEITIPHKLLTYLSTGKPIISAVSGEVNKIVEKASAGYCCNPESPKDISEAILWATKLTERERETIKRKSQSFFWNNYTKDILTKKWGNLILKTLYKQK